MKKISHQVEYAHILEFSAKTYSETDTEHTLRVNIQYELQDANKRILPLPDARAEIYEEHIQKTPFSSQQILDHIRTDVKSLIIKVKKEQAGFDINLT